MFHGKFLVRLRRSEQVLQEVSFGEFLTNDVGTFGFGLITSIIALSAGSDQPAIGALRERDAGPKVNILIHG